MNAVEKSGKITKHKLMISAYFIASAILLALGMIPLGYSKKNNTAAIIFLTSTDCPVQQKVSSMPYSESYTLSTDDDIQLDTLFISYIAADPQFKGSITADLFDENQLLKTVSFYMAPTNSEEDSSTVALEFGNGTHLLRDHTYTLKLQIDANHSTYSLLEYNLSSETQPIHISGSKHSILASMAYTPVAPIRYNEVFPLLIPFLIIAAGLFVLHKIDIKWKQNRYINTFFVFLSQHYNEIILLLIFIYLALYELYYAYIQNTFISPDSANYLHEAEAILSGYGFNQEGLSGYNSWFATWPIGYPLLIAAVAFVSGKNVYLSSKILSILLMGVFLLLLYMMFQKKAWIYGLCLFNTGFLMIYCFTWSEIPFCVGLLSFCMLLTLIIKPKEIKFRYFVLLGINSVFLFLCRYFGTFSLIVIGIFFLFYLGAYLFLEKYRTKLIRDKLVGFTISGLISAVCIGGYYLMNYFMAGSISGSDRSRWWDEYTALTDNLYQALTTEFFNVTRVTIPDVLSNFQQRDKAVLVILFLAVAVYLLYRYKSKDFRLVFISVGIFYDLLFILIRYHSSMDAFGYRFFTPATILITIGMLGFLSEFLNRHKRIIAPILICLLALSIKTLYISCHDFNRGTTSYALLKSSVENEMSSIPYHSAILASTLDYKTAIFRPDIYSVSEPIARDETMDDLFQKYGNSEYICIQSKYLKEILIDPIYEYDESIIHFFDKEIIQEMPDEQYIIISVKRQEIIDNAGR